MIRYLSRSAVNVLRWDACVNASPDGLLYGQSWYLDAVCPRWAGLVSIAQNGDYAAVLPVPLRRKFGQWVVHQPLFCQFLRVFIRPNTTLDPTDFYEAMRQHVRYGSSFCSIDHPPNVGFLATPRLNHRLDLQANYSTLQQGYTADRRANLRRAKSRCTEANGWTIRTATDLEPLLRLFKENHADGVGGGVANWAYDRLRHLFDVLQGRGLTSLRYADQHGQPQAGALFVEYGGRIIYLFNAASKAGRQANARTLLLDGLIRERAGQAVVFDFESPDVPDIARFYESFGAQPEPYWLVQYSRLTEPERWVRRLLGRG